MNASLRPYPPSCYVFWKSHQDLERANTAATSLSKRLEIRSITFSRGTGRSRHQIPFCESLRVHGLTMTRRNTFGRAELWISTGLIRGTGLNRRRSQTSLTANTFHEVRYAGSTFLFRSRVVQISLPG